MFPTFAISALLFELGSWFGFSMATFRNVKKTKLIDGFSPLVATPIVDGYLTKDTIHMPRMHRALVLRFAKVIRYVVNTKAFELVLLKSFNDRFNGRKAFETEVKLFA